MISLLAHVVFGFALGFIAGRIRRRPSSSAEPVLTVHQARGHIEPPLTKDQWPKFRTIRGGKSC